MMIATVLSLATSVGGCWWPISDGDVLVAVTVWKFSNHPPNSDSVADALHSSLCCIIHVLVLFMGTLIVLVRWVLVLGNNIYLLCFVPLVLICRMHLNTC